MSAPSVEKDMSVGKDSEECRGGHVEGAENGEQRRKEEEEVSIQEGRATIVFRNEAEVFYNPGRVHYY